MKKKIVKRYYDNMLSDRYYVKGVRDSTTSQRVLASRSGNYFSPDVCYMDYVKNLPDWTYYVDCEASV